MIGLAIPVGIVIGLSLGALGGGGSILTVPALVYLLGQDPHRATEASLVIVGLTALVGMLAHLRAGRVRLRAGLAFGLLGAGGSYLGSRLSASVSPHVLLAAFSVLILVAAGAMVRRQLRRTPTPAPVTVGPASEPGADPEAPHPAPAPSSAGPLRLVLAASVVGLLTGFFGVGGGFVVVPALVLTLGFDMATAVGTSLLVIAINAATALASRAGTPAHLDLGLLLPFTAAAMGGTLVGSRISSLVRPERLVLAFAALLVLVAAYTGARSIPYLV